MQTERIFEAPVVAGLYTGWLLGNFGDLHECAEWVMGRGIFTHEFADKALLQTLRDLLERGCPEITETTALVEGCSKANWAEKAAAVTARWPEGITLPRGGTTRTESPFASMRRLFPDKPVLVVRAETQED